MPEVLTMTNIDALWLLIAAWLVFLMQAGFLCLEAGLSRAKHSMNVATKNIADYVVASIAFYLVGYGLMFGRSWGGVIGTSDFAFSSQYTGQSIFFIYQLVFCATAATIVSGAVAERMKFKAYLCYSILISVFVYPLFGHWVWGGSFYTNQMGWLARLGYLDFAGSSVVHQIGGWLALAGIVVLGPRLGKFDAQGTPQRLIGHNIPLALVGIFLLWLGWFGFNGGSTLVFDQEAIGTVLVNTNIAAAMGAMVAMMVGWYVRKRPDMLDLGNGALAGLVSITAPAFFVDARAALLIGSIAGVVAFAAIEWLERGLKLDDVIGAVSVHGVCGAWGVIATAIFAQPEALLHPENRLYHIGIQTLGCVVCFALAFGGGWLFFKLLNRCMHGGIRVSEEAEIQGLNVSEHQAVSPLLELSETIQAIGREQDWSKRATVDSYSDVAELGLQFNQLLDETEQTMDQLKQSEKTLQAKKQAFETTNTALERTTTELLHAKTGLEAEVRARTVDLEHAKADLEAQVEEQTADLRRSQVSLEAKLHELERFHDVTLGREERVIELKSEVNRLTAELAKHNGGNGKNT